jgi:hypothetical protein
MQAYEKAHDKSVKLLFSFCQKKFPPRFFDILYKNEDIFQEDYEGDTEFLPHIHFKSLWQFDLSQTTRDTIWKYLQLIMFAIVGSLNNKEAFGDSTGENCDKCQLCKEPTGQLLMEQLCGKGLVRAVERELRPIEFKLQVDTNKKTRRIETMVKFEGRALSLFQDLCELLNMKCPRCDVVFADYDGCNALSCRVTSCGAAFCAVCLQDCGQDAHEHVRSQHGDLHDRDAFHRASKERVPTIMQEFIKSMIRY